MIQKPQEIIKVLSAGETSNTNNPEQYTGKNPKGWNGWEYEFHYDGKSGREFEKGSIEPTSEDQANDILRKHSSQFPNSKIVYLKEK